MVGIVELWAQQLGWRVRKGNVIVEGESDVFYFEHTARLYKHRYDIDLLGDDFSVIAAGKGNAGGVDGVNERFRAARELAVADVHPDGTIKYRFIGLFDNDEQGRRAFSRGAGLSRRVEGYRDLFLLHPVMPLANGATAATVKQRAVDLNKNYLHLDWEIEDLVAPEIYRLFEAEHSHEIIKSKTIAGKTHRDLTWTGKFKLQQYVREYAELEDLLEFIVLISALRNHLRLRTDHLQLPVAGR
nr:hypothetical protein [uncultured Rhodopila sp.]